MDSVRIDRASGMVRGGIFRVTRNTIQISPSLILEAWAIWLGGFWVWGGPVVVVLWLDRY